MSQHWKYSVLDQVITVSVSGKHHMLPSAADSGTHLQDRYLRLARYRQATLVCCAYDSEVRRGIKISSTNTTGATDAECSCTRVSVQR